ncbi:hypothetical protein N7457_007129 [Penicillium paradoxum]|uniref:uncharacterized protein n=1 Tax=Penicillium paradoxum TaxID=176176 RepID=UPI0025499E78|nr:uncharacterized protein N7457_007129 [Penicillium paradoxum]KAJ5779409.1 hypothetical protein N7457_007129 [Penicillium paradoxum]
MARFLPTGSKEDQSPTDELTRRGRRQRMAGKLEHHTKQLSDQCWQATRRTRPSLGRTASRPDPPHSFHRKAVSLDTNDESAPKPRWPGNMGPAITTVQPRYPPPKRTPTPPGVPSFGTPEAMSYSAQFLMPDNNARPTPSLGRGGPTDEQRSSSYGETIRRFFGFSSMSRAGGLSVRGIGRAQDGTIVQGRFPYRQSGHGMNVGRQLQDHPFHRLNLPIAHPGLADASHDHDIETAQAKDGLKVRSRRHFQLADSSSRRHLLSPGRAFSFPSTPESAVVNHPRQPRATAILGLPRNLSVSDVPSITITSTDPTEASIQGTRANRDHLPPNPSRLHTVLTMAVRGGSADEDPHAGMPVCADVLSWVKSQTCLCCCFSSYEEPESPSSLGPTSSQETYATAQSQLSPAESQNENPEGNTRLQSLQLWISSVYGVMFPTLVNPTAV